MTRSTPPPAHQQIHALLHTQCETLKAQISELERLCILLASDAADDDTLQALIRISHRIAGTGGTMGFDILSHKAFALETFAKQLLRRPPDAQGIGTLRALTRALAAAGANLTPEQSRLRQRLMMRG